MSTTEAQTPGQWEWVGPKGGLWAEGRLTPCAPRATQQTVML